MDAIGCSAGSTPAPAGWRIDLGERTTHQAWRANSSTLPPLAGTLGSLAKKAPQLPPGFHAPVRAWFAEAFEAPTRAQLLGWGPILEGRSTLILAPTGSGKTLAAFLAAIDRLMFAPVPSKRARCRVLYVSPLKALAVDIERNLRAPIAGIAGVAARDGIEIVVPTVEVRTGDTPQAARARMVRAPPDILITTPESLYLLLTSASREILTSIDTVIVDEIHSMVPTKRGAHLFLSLERLEALRGDAPRAALQRIGLSATQRPLDEVARLLGGRSGGADDAAFRPVEVIDAGEKKRFDLRVEVPVEDMSRLGELEEIPSGPAGSLKRKSIWPSIHPRLLELIRAHRSTILFVNSRRLAERLAAAINELASKDAPAPVEIALAHHGSVAREKRTEIEDRLKRGALPAIVATSSLELGIDMGAVDLVVQIEAPPSVASAMQRIGRAGHQIDAISKGVIFPKHRGDLLSCAAATARMTAGEVEATYYPRNALDVLAQQIVAMCAVESHGIAVDTVFDLVRRAAPWAELPRGAFEGVLDMLSGRYPSDEFAELRPRVTWDRAFGTLRAREGASRLAIVNGGTIADRGLFGVFLADRAYGRGETAKRASKRVGELDEEMVFESRVGDVFLLGASSWRIEEITHDRVVVSPAPGEPGKMPFWHGDRPGRPTEFGRAIGALGRTLAAAGPKQAMRTLQQEHGFDERAAKNLVAYIEEQKEATGVMPTDETLVVERFVDEIGDWRICVLSPLGARIHAPWATAVAARLEAQTPGEVDVIWSDDGMVFRLPQSDAPPATELLLPSADEIEDLVVASVSSTSLFAARFRECAARSLLLPRRHPTKRTPLWAQRKRAADLLSVAARHPSFPIILETYRECLRDVFDLPNLVDTLRRIEQRRLRVVTVDSRSPSPFAASLLFSYVASFIYDGDAPLAERRAHALGVDHAQLRELLGEAELRELIDPEAIDEHQRALQRVDGSRPARSADGVHDLLLSIGDLTLAELRARIEPSDAAPALLATLEQERRIVQARIAKEKRWIAAEDAARYRDALGVVLPMGLPSALLETLASAGAPIDELVARFARTHGPFVEGAVVRRFGLAPAVARAALERLEASRRVVAGAFLRGGHGREWCDVEVLRALRRKSLAKLRKEIEPVEVAAFGKFLPEWQGVIAQPVRAPHGLTQGHAGLPKLARASASSLEALLAVIERLEGAPIPASVLEREVLPARLPGYRAADLDALCIAGEVVWAGVESIGPSDGRIALYLAGHEALLTAPPARDAIEGNALNGGLVTRLREVLGRRGAVFFTELTRELGGYPAEIVEALWSLVWSGEVTNDTLAPLRSRVAPPTRSGRAGRAPRAPTRLGGPPGSEGRWSLRASRWGRPPSETERRAALARTLLDRYGVLTREAVHAEGIAMGFSAVYDVLKAMEEAGRVRRGYFIAGRGATQFALPGAIDRLRATRQLDDGDGPGRAKALVLAATDPANAYGATLPWPESEHVARPQRAVGASVVLHEGALIGFLGRSEHALSTYLPSDEPARGHAARALAEALGALVDSGVRRAVLISSIDGAPAGASKIAGVLRDAGFSAGAKGLLRRRRTGEQADAGR